MQTEQQGGEARAFAVRPDSEPTNTEYFQPFERMPIAVHSMGRDGLLRAVNGSWVAYTGVARHQAIGRSFADFLDPESALRYRSAAVPEMIGSVATGQNKSVEYRLVKASGETADIVLTARPERDGAGRFLHSLAVINDITARNRAEQALRTAQKLEAIGALTSGVAHDFNNLLMIIQSSLQLLSRHLGPGDARGSRLIDAALEGAGRGAALTARLLAFARLQDLTPRAIEPDRLVAALRPRLLQLLGPLIALVEDLPPGQGALRADPNQLDLALLNLAANARDAMPQGGTVRIAARSASVASSESAFIDQEVQPRLAAGDYIVVTVSDTGIGMEAGVLARAADPFFTTKGVGKGTGLGLSMVHGFVVQSGGALQLRSHPGAGTAVDLWLPRADEIAEDTDTDTDTGTGLGAPADDRDTIDNAARRRALRILLVDDDKLVIAGTLAMLEALGCTDVRAVNSGTEALAALANTADYDLLLTDYMMPGVTGVQLAVQARTMRPGLPVLLASGFAELDDRAGTLWTRLRKPYTLDEMAKALDAIPIGGG